MIAALPSMTAGPSTLPIRKLVRPVETWNPDRADAAKVFTYIDLSSVDSETKAIIAARSVTCGDAPSRARQLVAARDVLVSTVRPNLNGVANIPVELDGATASTGFCVLRPNSDKLHHRYLFHWVTSPRFINAMVKMATGASYPAVSDRIILDSEIPLPLKNGKPDVDEQKRIAAILDKADAIRRKRQQALRLTDDFHRSVFLEMFGDPVTNPKGWDEHPLEHLLSTPPRIGTIVPATEDGGFRVVRVGELGCSNVALDHCGRVTIPASQVERYSIEKGDILLARAIGSLSQLGKASVFQGSAEPVIFDSHVMRLRTKSERLRAIFFYRWLTSEGGRTLLVKQGGQTAVQFNINARQIQSLRIPLPPAKLQKEFEGIIERSNPTSVRMEESLSYAEVLFSSLQQRAFQGEL